MMKPATSLIFHISTTLTNEKGEGVGEVVRSEHADVWRSHFGPAAGMRLSWTVDGKVRRWKVLGVDYVQHLDTWVVAVSESRMEEEKAA